jgi:hypothetical protein
MFSGGTLIMAFGTLRCVLILTVRHSGHMALPNNAVLQVD